MEDVDGNVDVVLKFGVWFGCLSSGVVTSEVSFQLDMMRACITSRDSCFCLLRHLHGMDDGMRSMLELSQTAQLY